MRDINKHARTHHILISLSSARDADERVSAKGAALERIHTHHSLNHRSKKDPQIFDQKHERVTNGRKPPKKNKKNTKLNDGSPLAGTPPRARNTKRRRSRDEEWFSHGESFNPTDLGAMLMSVAGFTLPSKEEIEQSLNTFWNRWIFFEEEILDKIINKACRCILWCSPRVASF